MFLWIGLVVKLLNGYVLYYVNKFLKYFLKDKYRKPLANFYFFINDCIRKFINNLFKIIPKKYILIGGGNLVKPLFINYDHRFFGPDSFIDEDFVISFKNNKFKGAFLQCIILHLSDKSVERLFSEIFRVLKRGSFIRLWTMDIEKIAEKYIENDTNFLLYETGAFLKTPTWKNNNMKVNNHNLFTYSLCNIALNKPKNNIRNPVHNVPNVFIGPPKSNPKKVKNLVIDKKFKELSAYLNSLIPNGVTTDGHKNSFTFEEIKKLLELSGFNDVKKSNYLNSEFKPFRKKYLDKQRGSYMYIEAIKL